MFTHTHAVFPAELFSGWRWTAFTETETSGAHPWLGLFFLDLEHRGCFCWDSAWTSSQLREIIVKVEYVAHVTVTSEALCNASLELLIFTVLPNTPGLPGQASVSLRGVHFFSFSPPGRKRPSCTTQGLKVRGTGKGSVLKHPRTLKDKTYSYFFVCVELEKCKRRKCSCFRKRPTPTPQTKVRVINVP